MAKKGKAKVIKTTIRINDDLLVRCKHWGLDHGMSLQEMVSYALEHLMEAKR